MGKKLLKKKGFPFEVAEAVKTLGENIRIARIRRRMKQEELAQKCGITRKTLYGIEKGLPGVGIGQIFSVLWVMGLLDPVKELAEPDTDEHGKILEAARQSKRVRDPPAEDNDF